MFHEQLTASPAHLKATVVAVVVAGIAGLTLFGGVWGGGPAPAPATVSVAGHMFYWTTVVVPAPVAPLNATAPETFDFHGVAFSVAATNWYSVAGGELVGTATLANGTAYPFALGAVALGQPDVSDYLTPGYAAGVAWSGGAVMDLLTGAGPTATG